METPFSQPYPGMVEHCSADVTASEVIEAAWKSVVLSSGRTWSGVTVLTGQGCSQQQGGGRQGTVGACLCRNGRLQSFGGLRMLSWAVPGCGSGSQERPQGGLFVHTHRCVLIAIIG